MSSRVEILSSGEADPWSRARGPDDYLRDYTAGMSHEQRLAQVKWLANLMDDALRIPARRSNSAGIRCSVCFPVSATC